MNTFVTNILPAAIEAPEFDSRVPEFLGELQEDFGVEFSLWNASEGKIIQRSSDQPGGDESYRAAMLETISNGHQPELFDEVDHVVALGIPLKDRDGIRMVAISSFVISQTNAETPMDKIAGLLACSQDEAADWVGNQEVWSPRVLLRLASNFARRKRSELDIERLELDVEKISLNLTNTYEEICLLYGVTQNLRISSSDAELAQLALDWLAECLPANAVAVQFLAVASEDEATYKARTKGLLIRSGDCPFDCEGFADFTDSIDIDPGMGPFVANTNVTSQENWQFDGVHQVIIVPLVEGNNHFGWLAAFNHTDGDEFGTVEASLLNSIGAILGIHAGNRELYRQQAEFLASVVRALTSAIDAKDPYTCGHSDRVARIAVALARELDCDSAALNTLYMAGLLHDIGKIGIDDNVLRKPGKLTDAEYEHIKLHPELGYKILADIKQLQDVLPVVLHHHEQWDGRGYPHGLKGEASPILARITAVADAYDAMTSDRPYRKGMPVERVEEIFRDGAGKQWDKGVIDAFFRVRHDIAELSRRERENLSLDVEQWRDERQHGSGSC
jgi:putative nucleotidyltransferase with HDIG domain